MVRRSLVDSRQQASAAIADGRVMVAGAVADKPARLVGPDEPVVLNGPPPRFVGRGGEKLDAALEVFGIDADGCWALDAGASTGGFTDCLLQRGAVRVTAVDVGAGQLHPRLRADQRVEVLERTNVRSLRVGVTPGAPFPLLVADLSFISLRSVAAVLLGELACNGADLVALVKPQFEAGRSEVSKGKGVIRDPAVWERVLREVIGAMCSYGAVMMDAMVSPLKGAEGNVEFLVHARAHAVGSHGSGGSHESHGSHGSHGPAEVAIRASSDDLVSVAVARAVEGR
jgi:23S rRNA (cytidine1920-2'-O)/16S rRNA (cytidine1409-2'-O)-methyltransferase